MYHVVLNIIIVLNYLSRSVQSVMFGAVLGMLLLGEKLMLWGWSGVAMLVTGIVMVATDPGDKVEEGTGSTDSSNPSLTIWIAPALICASGKFVVKNNESDRHSTFLCSLQPRSCLASRSTASLTQLPLSPLSL
jgi:drug/metabolite transporter (DMT)-like permease